MADLKLRGKVYYSWNLRYPQHPKADKRGDVRIPLDTDKKEARRKLTALEDERDAHRHGRGKRDADWKTWSADYLARRKAQHLSTYKQDAAAFNLLARLYPGIRKMSDFNLKVLDGIKAHLQGQDYPTPTINRRVRSITTALNKALAYGDMTGDAWWKGDGGFGWLDEPEGRLIYWTPHQVKDQLLPVCHGQWEWVARIGCWTGLRRGELHHLSGERISESHIRIDPIECSCKCKDCLHHRSGVWYPKNKKNRSVYIPMPLRKWLAKHPAPKGWVIAKEGDRPSMDEMTTYFGRLIRKAGLPGSLHTARHTFGAWATSTGMSPRALQKQMGHTRIETTLIYSHVLPGTETVMDNFPAS